MPPLMKWERQTLFVQWLILWALSIKNNNSQNIFAAQIDARRFATDITRYIKDAAWSTSDSLTFKELEKFTEFFAYMMLLHHTCHHSALSLNYKKDDELHEFAFKLRDKLVQDKKTDPSTTAIAVLISPKGTPERAFIPSPPNPCEHYRDQTQSLRPL